MFHSCSFHHLTIFLGCVLGTQGNSFVLHEQRDFPLNAERQRIEAGVLLPMRIGLTQNREAELNAEPWLMEVSDPDSALYGQHWSQQEVIEAFKPSDETILNVTAWLHSHGIFDFTHSDNELWFAFDIPVWKAEKMLDTKYYENMNEDGSTEASCDYYYLPSDLVPYIDLVKPGVKAHLQTRSTRKNPRPVPWKLPPFNSSTSLAHCAHEVTPTCIRALYNIPEPDTALPTSPTNNLGLFESENILYYQGDLDLLYQWFAPYIPNGTSPIFHSIDGAPYYVNETRGLNWVDAAYSESELDLEVALPLVYPQNVTVFQVGESRPDSWRTNFFNKFLDVIDGSYCTEAQRGNSSADGKPQCGTFKPTNVISYSYGAQEYSYSAFWRNRQCQEYLKLGLQGVSVISSSGDDGVGAMGISGKHGTYPCKAKAKANVFMGQFPATCPWVTTVGATEIRLDHTIQDGENGAEWSYFYNGTRYYSGASGGGFSLHYPRPDYQADVVSGFFDNHDPKWPYFEDGHWRNSTGRYNRNGRGFPDISAIGAQIATFNRNKYFVELGTSASAPIVASIFTRIVEERIRAGKGPLGFVNPTLYKHPQAFNDIIKGANGYCYIEDGFAATTGWDPVTGLGTPDYAKLLDIFMSLP